MKQTLSDAIDDFNAFRQSRGIAKGTLAGDRTTLKYFLANTGNIWCHSINDRHITRHFETRAQTCAPQTLNNDTVRLDVFFEWLRKTHRIPMSNDPMYGRTRIKTIKRERSLVHVSKFPALLDAAERRCARDRAACALLIYTLARDSEITSLQVRDVMLESGYIKMRIHKTKQEDLVPICTELDGELRRWMSHMAAQPGGLAPNHYLVPARRATPVWDDGHHLIVRHEENYVPDRRLGPLHKVVHPALTDIGFPVTDQAGKGLSEGAHTLRRSGARALFDQLSGNGYDGALRIVQSMLHHASVTTTEQYIGVTADRRTRDSILRGHKMYADLHGSTQSGLMAL